MYIPPASVAVALCLLVTSHAAAALADEGILSGRPTLEIVRTDTPPVLDGNLDDPVWQVAAKIDTFVQQQPRDGDPATERTEVWAAYDNHNLYFAFYAHYSDPSLIRASRADRDKTFRDDTVSVYFDTFLDQQRAYKFSVNGYGVQGDAIKSAGGGGRGGGGGGGGGHDEDSSWDALFLTKGHLVEDGWTVEMAIPFKSLRYPARPEGESHRWGFQILRSIQSKDEDVVWSPVSRDVAGFLTQMGVIHGMVDVSTSRNLEILPTLTTVKLGSMDTTARQFQEGKAEPDLGVNLKYGVTSDLTLDFAYNPDFSQIESDRPQITVNQRYPLFYEEQRPFFLEGKEMFDTPINVIHTRAIVDPRYGGKLTGKAGRWSMGVLAANDEAEGHRDEVTDPAYGRKANVFVGRARYDLYAESYLGVVATNRDFMDSYSRLGGIDGRFRLGQVHSLQFMAAAADWRNTEAEEGDPERASGPGFQVEFRRSARNLSYSIEHTNLSPGFDTTLGFIRRNDIVDTQGNISYRFWPQGTVISWGPRTQYQRIYDHAGVLTDTQAEAGMDVQFARNIRLNAQVSQDMERYAEVNFDKRNYSLGGGVNFSRFFSVNGNFRWGDAINYDEDNPFLGRGLSGHGNVTFKPTSRFETNLSLNLSRLTAPVTRERVFDVQIYRARSTYQFSDRLLLRNIIEYDTDAGKFGANVLFTYRINSGTVFFLGYDDRFQRAYQIEDDDGIPISYSPNYWRTSRSFFTKISYLFRY